MLNIKKFKNPDSIYRSAPFWGLNDKLEAGELVRQLKEFQSVGIGGAFLHPRGGMSTVYLSEEYFQAIDACVNFLESQGMIAWLYDEDKFPSGVAGGKVTAKTNDYAAKEITASFEEDSRGILVSTYETQGKSMYLKLNQGWPQARFNNQSYVDVCSKSAIDEFIKITHDVYYERYKDKFGGNKTIPAIFTDEPSFTPEKNSLPWTKDFEVYFKEAKGYDIMENLHKLFVNVEDYAKVRFDYWEVISNMFVTAFSKNIFDWCEEHGVAYTGHFWEHVFPEPNRSGSVMPHYEYMQMPGIDMLFVSDEQRVDMYGNDLNVKEVSSVANQLGKERVLSETHGGSGWGLDFKYQKRATDWQLALGINLLCQHLSLYSMTGYRKRDFPQSFLDHQPWWKDYKLLGDYMGRMCYALTQGKYQSDVLLLHPSSSTWVDYSPIDDNVELTNIESSVKGLCRQLNQNQIMYDLGDDVIMSKHAKVKGNSLIVGQMAYKVVILPRMSVMRRIVFDLLKQFTHEGGVIIATDNTPILLDGCYSQELVDFCSNLKKAAGNELISSLNSVNVESMDITDVNNMDVSNIYCHVRREDDKKTVFICNLDLEQSNELNITLDGSYLVTAYNGETGVGTVIPICNDGDGYFVEIKLHPINSTLLLIDEGQLVKAQRETIVDVDKIIQLKNWEINLKDNNAINLQSARVSIDGLAYNALGDILAQDDHIKDGLGIERGNIMVRQPWMISQTEKDDIHRAKVEYPFTIAELPIGEMKLASELIEVYNVYINDVKIQPTGEFYKDRAFALYDIKPFIFEGENIVRLETDSYGVLINLESVYIVGDFKFIDSKIYKPTQLKLGDVTRKGYPYYSGAIDYTTNVSLDDKGQDTRLCFGEFQGITAEVIINGRSVKSFGWEPYSVNITSELKSGDNTITIRIANSLQNLLGPHDSSVDQKLVTPGSFYTDNPTVFESFGFDGIAWLEVY